MEDKTTVKGEMIECIKCSELESKCLELKSEIEKKNAQFEKLEAKFRDLEGEKKGIEEELKGLKGEKNRSGMSSEAKFRDLEGEKKGIEEELKALKGEKNRSGMSSGVVDLTREEEGDEVAHLMIENRVLECEKKRAESEVEILKQRLKELESRVLNEAVEGTPCNKTPSKHIICMEGERGLDLESKPEYGRRVRKNLAFEEDRSPSKKMAPSTPGGARIASLGLIDICDSDDEPDVIHVQVQPTLGEENVCILTDHPLHGAMSSDKEITANKSCKSAQFHYSYEENMDNCNDSLPVLITPKRKRASNIVTSDTESDEDDVPICKLKRLQEIVSGPICKLKRLQEIVSDQVSSGMRSSSGTAGPPGDENINNCITHPRRRLRKCTGKSAGGKSSSSKTDETKDQQGNHTTEDVKDDVSENAGSDSEGESLNSFIVDDSTEDSDGDHASSDALTDSDDDMGFDEILSRIKRTKDQNLEWEFEADMLAAFGKDPELCMKAVCALYRQQTSEEKAYKGTLVYNSRGFSKFDARRGTGLAEFLTDGDPEGGLKKSVEELKEYDRKGVELCRTLANRYSKQLFEIYKNKEDRFFP